MKDYFLLISTGRQQGRDSSELHLLLSLAIPYLQLQVSTSPLNIRKDTKNRNLKWPTCTWISSVSVSTRGFQHFGFSSLLSTYLKHSLNSLDITIWVTWSFHKLFWNEWLSTAFSFTGLSLVVFSTLVFSWLTPTHEDVSHSEKRGEFENESAENSWIQSRRLVNVRKNPKL